MVFGFLVNGFAPLVGAIEWLKYSSLLYYYEGRDPITNGVDAGHLAVLAVAAVALTVVAALGMRGRDLRRSLTRSRSDEPPSIGERRKQREGDGAVQALLRAMKWSLSAFSRENVSLSPGGTSSWNVGSFQRWYCSALDVEGDAADFAEAEVFGPDGQLVLVKAQGRAALAAAAGKEEEQRPVTLAQPRELIKGGRCCGDVLLDRRGACLAGSTDGAVCRAGFCPAGGFE